MAGLNEVSRLDNLQSAWERSARWARDIHPFFDACEVEEFHSRLSQELLVIQAELLGKSYTFSPYFSLAIPKPSGGSREWASPGLRDSVVAQAMLNVIGPILQSHIPDCAYAYRWLSSDTRSDRTYENWGKCYSKYCSAVDTFLTLPLDTKFIKTDIAAFYDTVDQDILLAKLGRILSHDVPLLELIADLIRYRIIRPDGSVETPRGLPTGPAYSHLLATFYLAELDIKWSQKAIGYARYVDDMVMVFSRDANVDDLLSELDSDLQGIGLNLNRSLDKTKVGTIGEPADLIDELKKKKYRIGSLALENGEEQAVENLRQLFQKTVWDFEDLDEMSKLTPHLKLVLWLYRLYRDSNALKKLVNLAYEAITAGIADPLVCRMAMLLIMHESAFNVDARFRHLMKQDDYLLQIMFLRLVIEEAAVEPPEDLIIDLAGSTNLLVRVLAFAALRSREIKLPPEQLRQLVEYQTNNFAHTDSIVGTYAYAARAAPPSGEVAKGYFQLLSALSGKENAPASVALVEFMSVDPDTKLLRLFLDRAVDTAKTSVLVRSLNSCILTGDLGLTAQVINAATKWLGTHQPESFRISLRKAYQTALDKGNIGLLIDLGNPANWQLGAPYDEILQTEAMLGLREATQSQVSETLAKEALPLLEKVLHEDPTSPVSIQDSCPAIEVEGVKYSYGRPVISNADSLVRLFEVKTPDGQLALLETVPVTVLNQMGFETLASWNGYLSTQRNNSTTFKTSSIEYQDVVFTIYHVPEGFHSVGSVRGQLCEEPEDSIFQLIARIGAAVELSKWAHGKFQSVGPCTVFIDLPRSIRFVGLALACTTPIYGTSNGLYYHNETSTQVYQFYLALLAAELLFQVLPTNKEIPHQYLEQQGRKLTRPFKYIWLRLAKPDPDHRYVDWDLAREDIQQAKAIKEATPTDDSADSQNRRSLYSLAAYLDFRLSIARRNPRLRKDALRDYVYEIVEQYLHEIKQESGNAALEELTDPYRRRRCPIGVPNKERRGLLFICRLLAALADAYYNVYQSDKKLQAVVRHNVAMDLLLSIVWLEAESVVKSLAIDSALKNVGELRQLIDKLRALAAEATPTDYANLEISSMLDGASYTPLSNLVPQAKLSELIETLAKICDRPEHDAAQLNFSTTSQLRLAMALLAGHVHLRPQGKEEVLSVGLDGNSDVYEWTQSFQFLCDLITTTSTKSHDANLMDSINIEMGRFLRASHKLHPFERKQAMVLRYNYLSQEGKVRFRRGIWLYDRYFNQNAVAGAFWERFSGVFIPGTVDLSDNYRGKNSPVRISIGPRQLLQSHRSKWRFTVRRLFSRDKSRRLLRAFVFFGAIGCIIVGFVWDWWAYAPGGLFFLVAVLWKWPEYWLFKT